MMQQTGSAGNAVQRGVRLGAAAAAHFLVDFACAFAMLRRLPGGEQAAALLLVYNFCAFALQMPLGVLADRLGRNLALAALGCLTAALGFLPLPLTVCAGLLGVGNALFHVGAGLEVLTDWPDLCGPLGVFVSPGAVGLYIGGMLGRAYLTPMLLPALLLLGAAAWLLAAQRVFRPDLRSENPPLTLPKLPWKTLAVLAGLTAVVAVRSLVGLNLPLPWKHGGWGAAAICALALGKAAGGFAADRFGLTRTAVVTLAACGGAVLLRRNARVGTGGNLPLQHVHAADPRRRGPAAAGCAGLCLRTADIRPVSGADPGLPGGAAAVLCRGGGSCGSVRAGAGGLPERGEEAVTGRTMAVSLLLTLALELPVVWLWGVRGRRNFAVATLCNVLTNPAAVWLHFYLVNRLAWPEFGAVAAVETAAVAAEALCYARCGENIRRPALLSLCANGFSWSVGFLLQLVI
jgi:FSR family fosmidomycin resistance protein-like MFS transporter